MILNYNKINSSLVTLTTDIFFLGEAIFLDDNLFFGEINGIDDFGKLIFGTAFFFRHFLSAFILISIKKIKQLSTLKTFK